MPKLEKNNKSVKKVLKNYCYKVGRQGRRKITVNGLTFIELIDMGNLLRNDEIIKHS